MALLVYLVQVIVYTALMYAVYTLFLRNRAIHAFNRAYLLLAVVVPVVLPFIKLPGLRPVVALGEIAQIRLPEISVEVGAQPAAGSALWYVGFIYIVVATVLLVSAIVQRYRLRKLVASHEKGSVDGYTLVKDTGYGPASWNRYILLPESDTEPAIIAHEAAHIRLQHSRDMLALQMVQIAFWPNIFLYLIKQELRQVHEFQADAAVRMDTEAYARLLLSNVFHQCQVPLTHSFILHPLKRRIMMLSKNQNKGKYIFARTLGFVGMFAVVACAVAVQSCAGKKWEVRNEDDIARDENGKPLSVAFSIEDFKTQPEFNGDLMAYMGENVKYPEAAKKNKVQGRVVVNFVVNANGNVTNMKVKESPDPILSAAALDVIGKMPRWIPGRDANGNAVDVELCLPVSFKL